MSIVPENSAFFFMDAPPVGVAPNSAASKGNQYRFISYRPTFDGTVSLQSNNIPYRELWSPKANDKIYASGELEGTYAFPIGGSSKTGGAGQILLQTFQKWSDKSSVKADYGKNLYQLQNETNPPSSPDTAGFTMTLIMPLGSDKASNTTGTLVGFLQLKKQGKYQWMNIYRVDEKKGKLTSVTNFGDFYVMYVATGPTNSPPKP